MTVTRDAIALHLNSQFSALATAISQASDTDTADGYGPDIDQALRDLGETTSLDTVTLTDAQAPAAFALAEYYALRRFERQMALKVDVQAGSLSQKNGTVPSTLRSLTEEAKDRASALGYVPGGSNFWTYGQLNLDYIEPEP